MFTSRRDDYHVWVGTIVEESREFFLSKKRYPSDPAMTIENFMVYDPPFAHDRRNGRTNRNPRTIPRFYPHRYARGYESFTLKIMEPLSTHSSHPSLEAGRRRCIYRRPLCTAIVGQIPRQWPPSRIAGCEVEWWRAEWRRRLCGGGGKGTGRGPVHSSSIEIPRHKV